MQIKRGILSRPEFSLKRIGNLEQSSYNVAKNEIGKSDQFFLEGGNVSGVPGALRVLRHVRARNGKVQ